MERTTSSIEWAAFLYRWRDPGYTHESIRDYMENFQLGNSRPESRQTEVKTHHITATTTTILYSCLGAQPGWPGLAATSRRTLFQQFYLLRMSNIVSKYETPADFVAGWNRLISYHIISNTGLTLRFQPAQPVITRRSWS